VFYNTDTFRQELQCLRRDAKHGVGARKFPDSARLKSDKSEAHHLDVLV
jgi:hypothetical protein